MTAHDPLDGTDRQAGDHVGDLRLAQAEPERADYQRDLVISLMRTAEGPEGREHLLRASSILEVLHDQGRLAPVDEPMIAELRRLLSS